MAKDDFFKIVYIILTELYETMKAGEKLDTWNISPERLQIPESYWLDIIEEMLREGYVKEVLIRTTKTGRAVAGIGDMKITARGIDYLQNNSALQKVKDTLKSIKDIMPGL